MEYPIIVAGLVASNFIWIFFIFKLRSYEETVEISFHQSGGVAAVWLVKEVIPTLLH